VSDASALLAPHAACAREQDHACSAAHPHQVAVVAERDANTERVHGQRQRSLMKACPRPLPLHVTRVHVHAPRQSTLPSASSTLPTSGGLMPPEAVEQMECPNGLCDDRHARASFADKTARAAL
jgi:hypothetical protein